MALLKDNTYSLATTLTSIRSFYTLLSDLYIPHSAFLFPPPKHDGSPGTWPQITNDSFASLGKDHTVITLLQHMPYIRYEGEHECVPRSLICDYSSDYVIGKLGKGDAEDIRIQGEGLDMENVPSSVIALTFGGRDMNRFLLDTTHGIVYWLECPDEVGEIFADSHPVVQDAEDGGPDSEVDWRRNAAWPVKDFFEVLKGLFTRLDFCPADQHGVLDGFSIYLGNRKGIVEAVGKVWREYGWPDKVGNGFDKDRAMGAVRKLIEEKYEA